MFDSQLCTLSVFQRKNRHLCYRPYRVNLRGRDSSYLQLLNGKMRSVLQVIGTLRTRKYRTNSYHHKSQHWSRDCNAEEGIGVVCV